MSNYSTDIVSDYLKTLDNFTSLEYTKLQRQIMSPSYRKCVKSILLQFYDEDNITQKMIRILGLLPVFLFNTKTIYNAFTYEEYVNMIKDGSISKDIDLDSSNITNNEKHTKMFYKVYFLYKKFRDFMLKVDDKNFDGLIIFIKSILDELYKNYNIWEKLDKQKQLEEVVQSYWEIELTKQQIADSKKYSEDQKDSIINTLQSQQTDMKKIIKQIDPKNGLRMLMKSIPIVIDELLIQQVKNNLELAYWNKIETDIINDNNYNKLLNTLNEMRDILYYLDSRDIFKSEVDEYFDTEFIVSLIKNNVCSMKYIKGLHTQLFNWLSNLDSVSNDDDNNKMFNTLNEQIADINDNINNINDIEDNNKKLKLVLNILALLYNFYFHKFNSIKKIKEKLLNKSDNTEL